MAALQGLRKIEQLRAEVHLFGSRSLDMCESDMVAHVVGQRAEGMCKALDAPISADLTFDIWAGSVGYAPHFSEARGGWGNNASLIRCHRSAETVRHATAQA